MTRHSRIWKHVRSGGLYRIVAVALIENNLEEAVVYESLFDGQVWVRPRREFHDGRFINLAIDEVSDQASSSGIEIDQ